MKGNPVKSNKNIISNKHVMSGIKRNEKEFEHTS